MFRQTFILDDLCSQHQFYSLQLVTQPTPLICMAFSKIARPPIYSHGSRQINVCCYLELCAAGYFCFQPMFASSCAVGELSAPGRTTYTSPTTEGYWSYRLVRCINVYAPSSFRTGPSPKQVSSKITRTAGHFNFERIPNEFSLRFVNKDSF